MFLCVTRFNLIQCTLKSSGAFFQVVQKRRIDDIVFKKNQMHSVWWGTNVLLDLRHINYFFEIFSCFIPLPIPQCIARNSNAISFIAMKQHLTLQYFVKNLQDVIHGNATWRETLIREIIYISISTFIKDNNNKWAMTNIRETRKDKSECGFWYKHLIQKKNPSNTLDYLISQKYNPQRNQKKTKTGRHSTTKIPK